MCSCCLPSVSVDFFRKIDSAELESEKKRVEEEINDGLKLVRHSRESVTLHRCRPA